MLIYLDQALREMKSVTEREGRASARVDLREAILSGAADRVRPKMIMAGLLSILWSTGTGSELMRRIAAPMIGGMLTSALPTLLVIPAIYALVKGGACRCLARAFGRSPLCRPRQVLNKAVRRARVEMSLVPTVVISESICRTPRETRFSPPRIS